jgi:putative ABC transport system permease protein
LGEPAQPYSVIGVVENHSLFLQGFGATSNAYTLGAGMTNLVVRLAADDVGGGLAAAEGIWRRLAPQAPFQRRFMDELFNENFEKFRQLSDAFLGLAAFAFFISIVGLFGMAVQVAGRRVHEIGVRKSMGARRSQIVRMLLRDFSKPVVIANLVAWPLGYFAAQTYLGIFMQRIALTPVPFVTSLAIVVAIAWAAVAGQALRAARANPASVLRVD